MLSGGDEKFPLVLSQTFDQAVNQIEISGQGKPVSVEVWYFTAFRSFFSTEDRRYLKKLRQLFPSITIKPIFGIQRYNDALSGFFFWVNRRGLKSKTVIFHCRTESAHRRVIARLNRNHDLTICDVRGAWWDEKYDRLGIEEYEELNEFQKQDYDKIKNECIRQCDLADGVVTVSEQLATVLYKDMLKKKDVNVVPCATNSIVRSFKRKELCEKLNIGNEKKIIVYSGGYARYQHLEDLTIPFVKKLIDLSEDIYFLALTFRVDIIRRLIQDVGIDSSKFTVMEVAQRDVNAILSGCDLGLLIRKPTKVNQYAQPVKVGEYLAAGVPVCFHKGVSGVSQLIKNMDAGIEVELAGQNTASWEKEAQNVLGFLENSSHNKEKALKLASEHFLWKTQVLCQRNYYNQIIESSVRSKVIV